ncbi:hypothetical protein [Lactobacillus delbrueckii]
MKKSAIITLALSASLLQQLCQQLKDQASLKLVLCRGNLHHGPGLEQ